MTSYFASQMNLRRRQVLIELQNDSYIVQAGAMQWTCGAVEAGSGIKGVGDLLGKAIASKVTKESAVKPEDRGSGFLMLEPTYRHILLLDVGQWNGLVLDDGLFLAASGTIWFSRSLRCFFKKAVARVMFKAMLPEVFKLAI